MKSNCYAVIGELALDVRSSSDLRDPCSLGQSNFVNWTCGFDPDDLFPFVE